MDFFKTLVNTGKSINDLFHIAIDSKVKEIDNPVLDYAWDYIQKDGNKIKLMGVGLGFVPVVGPFLALGANALGSVVNLYGNHPTLSDLNQDINLSPREWVDFGLTNLFDVIGAIPGGGSVVSHLLDFGRIGIEYAIDNPEDFAKFWRGDYFKKEQTYETAKNPSSKQKSAQLTKSSTNTLNMFNDLSNYDNINNVIKKTSNKLKNSLKSSINSFDYNQLIDDSDLLNDNIDNPYFKNSTGSEINMGNLKILPSNILPFLNERKINPVYSSDNSINTISNLSKHYIFGNTGSNGIGIFSSSNNYK
jgi:hypothetical protein